MKRSSVILLLVGLIGGSAFATNTWEHYTGNWSDPGGWSEGRAPSGEEEVKIKKSDSVCTLNTSTGDWGVGQRLRVYEEATLLIEDGAELLGAGWMRVGATNPGTVVQSGGLVQLTAGKDDAKLGIGDQAGSDGFYTISGGTLTYSGDGGDLLIGARGGQGTFTIIETDPSIQMNRLFVGDSVGASGTLEYKIGSGGVSPISLAGSANLDPEGDGTTALLVLSLIAAPPADTDILLIDGTAAGQFDAVNGGSAVEGALVTLDFGGTDYYYSLTYADGVALQWVPEPSMLALFGLGSLIAVARRPRKE